MTGHGEIGARMLDLDPIFRAPAHHGFMSRRGAASDRPAPTLTAAPGHPYGSRRTIARAAGIRQQPLEPAAPALDG